MTQKRTWEEFRESGLLWFVNTILHMFGWSIILEINEDNRVTSCYPGRVRFRGFSEDCNDRGYEKVARFLRDNAEALYDEADYKEAND